MRLTDPIPLPYIVTLEDAKGERKELAVVAYDLPEATMQAAMDSKEGHGLIDPQVVAVRPDEEEVRRRVEQKRMDAVFRKVLRASDSKRDA